MGRKKSKANYFTQETEDAIVAYNNSTSQDFRNTIFREKIYYPFYKLVENIIHTYKFYYTDVEDIENLKYELISILVQDKIHLFDPTRGAKAYSYFGTIIKRHLIHYNNTNYKKLKSTTPLDNYDEIYNLDEKEITPYSYSLKQIFDIYIKECYSNLDELFKKEEDKVIADAILTLFQKREDLDIFKKKALYIYIREITGTQTPTLTKVIQVLKKEFYTIYERYDTHGLVYRD